MSKSFAFKKSQNFRICVDKVSFYATKKQIISGVGDFRDFNISMQMVLRDLEETNDGFSCDGILTTRNGISVQLNVAQNS